MNLQFRPPDCSQERNGNIMLIWGDIPYWLVVDLEFYDLLLSFDGKRNFNPTLTSREAWNGLQELIKTGVLVNIDAPGRKEVQPAPVKIQNIALNLTRKCNLRCRFCYNLDKLTPNADTDLSADEIINVLKGAAKLLAPKPSLTILGGEPLTQSEKLLKVAAYAVHHKFNSQVLCRLSYRGITILILRSKVSHWQEPCGLSN